MKRRKERARLQRLSEAVGKAAIVGKAEVTTDYVAKAYPLPAVIPAIDSVAKPVPATRNIPLIILAYSLGIIGLGVNGWFSYSRGATEVDKILLFSLGFICEAIAFYLPSQTSQILKGKRYGAFVLSCLLCVFLFIFAVYNSLGFASANLNEITTAKSERITPAVSDAQRRLDTLSASRASECQKRGDKCRQLERDEQLALEQLREAREKVSAMADPQVISAARIASWISLGRYNPSEDDFAMLRLLLLTLLPQLGGLVLMLSFR